MYNTCVFISGRGTNLKNLIYFAKTREEFDSYFQETFTLVDDADLAGLRDRIVSLKDECRGLLEDLRHWHPQRRAVAFRKGNDGL